MGLTVRHIQLEPDGREIEVYAVAVPLEIEAAGGAAVDAFVADVLAQREAPAPSPITEAAVTAGGY